MASCRRLHAALLSTLPPTASPIQILLDSVDQPQVLQRADAGVGHVCARHGHGGHPHSGEDAVSAGVEVVERYVHRGREGGRPVLERRPIRAVAAAEPGSKGARQRAGWGWRGGVQNDEPAAKFREDCLS